MSDGAREGGRRRSAPSRFVAGPLAAVRRVTLVRLSAATRTASFCSAP
ncbi:hypothetical protein A33M_2793 [Rhodovulum sp. PH10]|nr:hypothetical protein A33M_2793 [Rhodovulum sp. PH10]